MNTHWTAAYSYFICIKSEYIHTVENNSLRFSTNKTCYLTGFIRQKFPIQLHQRISKYIGLIKNEFLIYSRVAIELIVPEIILCIISAPGQFVFFIQSIIFVNCSIVIKGQMIVSC